ncbi:hypothetical protein [Streptomyces sp. P17]|uniref:hypothetical protein n=1 Tax=Streptomyces sp. P17 TaxID=3074716 RepID=UPI0028F42ACE|nr:hypothetical protein [Streptomyces sp. P17]MDT9698750.1 hypothetical protein [Streptomyces sp. P17]
MTINEEQLSEPVTVTEPQGEPEPPSEPHAPKDRRLLRAALRWTAAVAVFAAVGAASAYGITRMERTDVPGLATESDGRWDYPTLTRPPLPSGRPGPFAESNPAGTHHADLRVLLLPAPAGATEDKALRGDDGWLVTKDFLAQFPDKAHRKELGQKLLDYGLRHIAARGWTTEDGTETRVYLLQFGTAAVVEELTSGEVAPYGGPAYRVRGDGLSEFDEKFAEIKNPPNVTRYAYVETKPYGAQQVRQAYLTAGDVLALVVQSRKGEALAVPFQQTVTLQSQLLG